MELQIGIVCGACDWYSPMKTTTCPSCGNDLALVRPPNRAAAAGGVAASNDHANDRGPESEDAGPATSRDIPSSTPAPGSSVFEDRLQPRRYSSGSMRLGVSPRGTPQQQSAVASSGAFDNRASARMKSAPPAHEVEPAAVEPHHAVPGVATGMSLEELMDQAKNFICRSCTTQVPMGHKFCGRCGAAVPPEILAARTQFFGQLQVPGKAKLILIRGEGVEGLSYQLNAEQHIVGRNGQLVFPDDPFVSPKHANLFYRGGKLVVRDEGSLNGVFLRVRGTVDISVGDHFLAGEQLFRVDATPKQADGPAPDGTYFYSSPKHQSPFRITQILHGGAPGMTVCARNNGLQIGREGGDLNFPTDLYMSASHCKLEESSGKLTLTDLNSRNGSYIRLKAERELTHGDYLFIGRKLLRVEITAA
jgi:pSer/pThr/pTyr-binding forkhead associated (FHA) protein/ribosomal protein L40E